MSYATLSSTAPRIRFLDVEPMISALQFQPTDFELSRGGWLTHVPSRHRFKFDAKGNIVIDAHCNCANRSVSAEQGQQLFQTFVSWRESYWQPLRTDREFASHFKRPTAWIRLVRDVRMAWRRFYRREESVALPAQTLTSVPAE
jgi:hypothetical protein